ncbi:L-rhamnose isomerase [Salmonella enterica subsp. arizonae]|uniref:L-rhamnose isomerase n=1 Tax=Salmonella enterica subsp. arizonae TaxID=59203 RepID=A0A379TMV7_SALER|nr:L-rhamnose isomerase [Salmonella enterica subsp. arizonae]
MTTQLEQAWELAKQRFAAVGIDVEEALRQLDRLPVSMHCWQGDDVAGFENPEGSLTAEFRLPAIIRAKRVMPPNCAPIWNKR